MPGLLCPHCLQPLALPLRDICPQCGHTLENGNPAGALPFCTLLGERYTVGSYLSADGDGLCYQGVDGATGQYVRIKEFFPVTLCNGRSRDGALLPQEGREVLFKTSLMDFKDLYEDLKNITPTQGLSRILDVWEGNNTVYAVEESFKGMTLRHYLALRPRPMPPAEACKLMQPVMEGVMAMHKAGLIHRGICPDTILLPIDGAARLTGYGTLALRTRGSELKSQVYAGYAAPEQYSAAEFAGTYTDVYALAAVIYRMVTNQKPLPAPKRLQHDTLETAHSLEAGVPNYFSQVLACALRLDATRRMQTVQELAQSLADPGVADAMFERGDGQVSTKKLLGVGLTVAFVVVALALWGLLGTAQPGARPAATATPVPATAAPAVEYVPDLTNKVYQTEIVGSGLYAEYTIVPTEEYSETVEAGRVIRQEPQAGAIRQPDQTLTLVISLGPHRVPMPNLIGSTRESAEAKLKELGIPYTVQVVDNDGSLPGNCVVECSIAAGEAIDPDSTPSVIVSVADERTGDDLYGTDGGDTANAAD